MGLHCFRVGGEDQEGDSEEGKCHYEEGEGDHGKEEEASECPRYSIAVRA